MGEVIRAKVLKIQQRNYKLALKRLLILFQSLQDLSKIFEENVALLTQFVTTTQQIDQHASLINLGEEGEEIRNLTIVLARTASKYNQM